MINIPKYKIFRAYDCDLGLRTRTRSNRGSHDVIVVSYNKRSKNCYVKTITSLEYQDRNSKWHFKDNKLDKVRTGKIVVIPKSQINTKVLSGVYNNPIKIKFNKLFNSTTGSETPKKYKNIIKKDRA